MKYVILILAAISSASAMANICGTDFQNFNPTTSSLDFVTVQSSETLKPCIINLGVFANYAANSLSYSQNYGGFTAGSKPNDRILGADLSLGFGLSSNWDVGISVPFVLSQELKDATGVTAYQKNGATEVKLNTKYRFRGDDSGGMAAIFSVNNNLIENNPFSGSGAGPTLNLELAADQTYGAWALGLNLGYRRRSPGSVIANQPFAPLADQWIYSAAASLLLQNWNSKLIFEIFGSSATKSVDYDSNRSLNALEGLVGIKHDLSQQVSVHFGGSTKLGNTIGGPDWRVYTGLSWALGPICKEAPVEKLSDEHFRLNVEVLFDTNSDVIRENDLLTLDTFIKTLMSKSFKKMQIEGHTDSQGPAEYNLDLSRRRALAVKTYIVNKFKIPSEQIATEGYGETNPIADNGNYQGRRQNRRVEFQIWR